MQHSVVFDDVSKKFRRGERHDSLRDLLPSLVGGLFRERKSDVLTDEEFWALRNVSFEVSAGEALGIIGPNGAGKSTTLKVLTRILKPTFGRTHVQGRVGALIEVAAGFHPDLTGRENILLQGAIMGMKRAEIAERFDEIVEFAGVGEFIDTPVKRYSSGMNARLGFSIAAHLRPDVLIIDEVLSVGDMTFQQKCYDRMRDFKRQGIAIVLVSHNLQAVSILCDKALYLAREVRAVGSAAEVLKVYVDASTKIDLSTPGSPVEIRSGLVVTGDGVAGPHVEVGPGTRLVLRLSGNSRAALDDVTFGFVVYRSTDQLAVYNGNIHRRDLGPATAFNGDFTLDFGFRTNLVRGHYYLSAHVFHNPTQTFFVPPRQLATITVQEYQSCGGIADVEFSAALRSVDANPLPRLVS
jgi:ABC-type polysaccharide/polyol phosphate transport system ATPase subunit